MKLEDQLCTLEQAKRLRELGITSEGYFLLNDKGEAFESWMLEGTEDRFYSTFTVAELGVMLPGIINKCKLTQWPISGATEETISYGMQYRFRGNDPVNYGVFPSSTIFGDTEAIVRANLLIAILEEKVLTAEECNKRLIDK